MILNDVFTELTVILGAMEQWRVWNCTISGMSRCSREIMKSAVNLLPLLRNDEVVPTVLEFLLEHLESEDLSNAFADQEVLETLLTLSTSTFIREETTNLSSPPLLEPQP